MKTIITLTTENDIPLNFSNDFCDRYPYGNTFIVVDRRHVEITLKNEMAKDYTSASSIASEVLRSYGCKVTDVTVLENRE